MEQIQEILHEIIRLLSWNVFNNIQYAHLAPWHNEGFGSVFAFLGAVIPILLVFFWYIKFMWNGGKRFYPNEWDHEERNPILFIFLQVFFIPLIICFAWWISYLFFIIEACVALYLIIGFTVKPSRAIKSLKWFFNEYKPEPWYAEEEKEKTKSKRFSEMTTFERDMHSKKAELTNIVKIDY